MAIVNYDDKEALYVNASIPNKNKVTADDMNNLKQVGNQILQTLGVFTDDWSSSGTYTIGDIVIYDNRVFRNLTGTNTATNPEDDTTNWEETTIAEVSSGVNIPIQPTAPLNPEEDDLWIDTSYDNRFKFYNGALWETINNEITGDTLPIGSIMPYGSSTAPANWLICDGSAVSRTTYYELFAVIGTSFGSGDGSTTFNLPNLKGKVPVGQDTSDTSFDVIGETGGEKTHTLIINEMPNHSHAIATVGGSDVGAGYSYTQGGGWNSNFMEAKGGSQPHNNLQPYQVVCYIIKAGQSAGLIADVSTTQTSSDVDAYSCNYINNLQSLLQTNKTSLPTGQAANCLMIDDFTKTHLCLYYNPTNAPEANQMVMWKAFITDNTGADAYWTYIVLALTLDDHKLWLNAYHNSSSSWMGWQQI